MKFGHDKNYDNRNDAHKLSNYSWWKKNHNHITDVKIDLHKLGVSNEKVVELFKGLVYCFRNKVAFALFTDDGESIIVFMPQYLSSKQGEIKSYYQSLDKMFLAVKLVLLTHHNIQIHQNLIGC